MLEFNIASITASSMSVNSQSRDISYPLVSSCNGLLCMVYSFKIFIWNPATRKYKMVKEPNPTLLKCYESTLYGFTYDSVSDDYKIIATFVISAKDSRHIVGIYSVKNESWKKIDTIPSVYHLFDQNPISFYGTINMMAARLVEGNGGSDFNEFVIISLIVADEKIVVTPVPPQYCGSQIKMSNFANHLYISRFVEMDFLVFSRDKDGERWTWTSFMNIPTLGSFIGLGNHNCYLDDIIFLKENEISCGGNWMVHHQRQAGWWKEALKGQKHLKSNEELLLEPTPSKVQTSHSLLTTKASDDGRGEETIDITPGVEWITRVDTARKAVEIIGKGLNEVD
ncbi:hypothetical protein H5410_060607, partial [Solanum commersonii]